MLPVDNPVVYVDLGLLGIVHNVSIPLSGLIMVRKFIFQQYCCLAGVLSIFEKFTL